MVDFLNEITLKFKIKMKNIIKLIFEYWLLFINII